MQMPIRRLSDTRRSTSTSAQFLGDKLVSWSSKKQKSTTISSTEAEYIALSGCCSQILWMRSQLTDYGFKFNVVFSCDGENIIDAFYLKGIDLFEMEQILILRWRRGICEIVVKVCK
ncbi:hypothetical protein Tco_0299413 [Tanacetum coccineum]